MPGATASSNVLGSYTYAEAGRYPLFIQIGRPDDTSFHCWAYATATVDDAPLCVDSTATVSAVANVPLPLFTPLAYFTDANSNQYASAGDLRASIAWKPGYSSAGTVFDGSAACQFGVEGSSVWGDLGPHNVTVNLYDSGGSTASATATVNVTDGTLYPGPSYTVPLDELTAGNTILVGNFFAQNPAAIASDFTVTADWGDGDVNSDGFVVPVRDGSFDVYAAKTTDYTGSTSRMHVTVTEDAGQSRSATTAFPLNFLMIDGGTSVTVTALPVGSSVLDDGVLVFAGSARRMPVRLRDRGPWSWPDPGRLRFRARTALRAARRLPEGWRSSPPPGHCRP